MSVENIVIAKKLTVLEYEANKYGYSLEESVAKFKQAGADGEKVLASHYRQLESFDKLVQAVTNPVVISGDDIDKVLLKPDSLLLAIGGDNYFQHVSHFLENQLIVGINADPETSSGALLNFTADSFVDFLPRLQNGEFNIEEWTRLQASLNGQSIPTLATSEIYYGAYKSTDMSRYLLNLGSQVDNNGFEQKSSGLIVATGAGITGWYKSASEDSLGPLEKREPISKSHPLASIFVREYFGEGPTIRAIQTDKLAVTWLAHGTGLLSIDARDEHEIKRGDTVEIKISDQPLRVVTP